MSQAEIETEIKVLRAMMKVLSPRTTMSKAAKDMALEVRRLELSTIYTREVNSNSCGLVTADKKEL